MAPKKKASGDGSSRVVRSVLLSLKSAPPAGATAASTARTWCTGSHPAPHPSTLPLWLLCIASGHSLSPPEQEATSGPTIVLGGEIDEKLKPPKKRRSSLVAAKTWSKRSSGGFYHRSVGSSSIRLTLKKFRRLEGPGSQISKWKVVKIISSTSA
ncbi:hypothetical protein Acr_06g0004890 [Actinidia rufa]|uniref:Uncharacterized protein n=1 Tax=Actinidia rufa TaxID=165716 RepID=A0A7J0ERE6_9ERIC|nr:hypothetical protein Acr_06g0004890 [Actinidia rufa]